jgi:Fe-S-cluster-containing dehydrogenase component/formate-dependent nitrite reductase membrane component NrfD
MNYGFLIDNRKCIGCHACTVACKSEHDVPIGVNRTWVKQTEKGEFPNARRVFSVLRCNHCASAPCVEICPVEALYVRNDGIVDFNNERCIGCKSCMQACPYDALYIDPDTRTAAKCNYCAHRIDIGLEPACVNVCPEHAIVSGDMDNPDSEISRLLAREAVTVRKPEKGTQPHVFYIEGDAASLTPSMTERSDQYIWGSQSAGVGHYARYLESRGGKDPGAMQSQLAGIPSGKRTVEVLMENISGARRVYDTPDKGILWGWEVAAYILTKGVASGAMLILLIAALSGIQLSDNTSYLAGLTALVFLTLTGALLVMDLDKPSRFLYVLLRPQWKSWLTRGGYAITLFGGLTFLWLISLFLNYPSITRVLFYLSSAAALPVAVYTAFLFAQAKGRDFWQSPTLALHMLIHSVMGGAAFISLTSILFPLDEELARLITTILPASLILNVVLMGIELTLSHPTQDAKSVVQMIVRGRYRNLFWFGDLLAGNVLPLLILLTAPALSGVAAMLALTGIYVTEKIWVEAPQRISLT